MRATAVSAGGERAGDDVRRGSTCSAPGGSGPAPSDAQIAPGKWNVERARCSDLLGASDEDRAAAAMFYYGYLAAKAGIHVIDVSQVDGNVSKVMSECAASPNLTVPQAFRQALGRRAAAR